jgi:sensor domain CHASE-containing protein
MSECAKTLAFLVEKYGSPENFDAIAAALLEGSSAISAIELVEKGVITKVYPLQGHEIVIGYDLLADSTRNKEAFRAVRERGFFIGGPLALKQGGMGVVGRYPIFRGDSLWGLSAVIVRFPDLILAAGMNTNAASTFRYQFSKRDPDSGQEVDFLPHNSRIKTKSRVAVEIPDGAWTIHIMPKKPVLFGDNWALLLFGGLSAAMAAYLIVHLLNEPGRLNYQIAQKTADLKAIAWMQSHRVRAPLARIMAISDLLTPEHFDPMQDKALLEELKKSSEELDNIIRDIVKRTEP